MNASVFTILKVCRLEKKIDELTKQIIQSKMNSENPKLSDHCEM